jgi:hypothetical protein
MKQAREKQGQRSVVVYDNNTLQTCSIISQRNNNNRLYSHCYLPRIDWCGLVLTLFCSLLVVRCERGEEVELFLGI